MAFFRNTRKRVKNQLTNIYRELKNAPRYLYAKYKGKPFRRTMRVREEEEMKGKSLGEKKKALKKMKNFCKSIRNVNPAIYQQMACSEYVSQDGNLTNENLTNVGEVNIEAIRIPVGNVNKSNGNLPMKAKEVTEPVFEINLGEAVPYTAELELQNIRNALNNGEYVATKNIERLRNSGDWKNLERIVRYYSKLKRLTKKNRGKRVTTMLSKGGRTRKH
jgi:hypothetical protein